MTKEESKLRYGIREEPPCKTCTDKYTACHDRRERFKEWKAKLEAVKEAKKAYERLNRRKSCQRTTY